MICHEAVDEGVRGGLHKYTREWAVEVVGVSGDLLVDPDASELSERLHGDFATRGVVDQVLKL